MMVTSRAVNLLPTPVVDLIEKRQLTRKWGMSILVSAGLAIAIIVIGQSLAAREQEKLDDLKQAQERPQELLAQNADMRKRLRLTKATLEQKKALTTQHSPLFVLSELNRIKMDLDSMLTLENFTQELLENVEEKEGQIQLTLIASSARDSAAVVRKLKDSGYFTDVKLTGNLERLTTQEEDLRFTLVCTF